MRGTDARGLGADEGVVDSAVRRRWRAEGETWQQYLRGRLETKGGHACAGDYAIAYLHMYASERVHPLQLRGESTYILTHQ